MIIMLRDGRAGLEDLMQAGSDTGYVLTEKTARGAEVFQDRLLDAQLTVKGLKNVIGAEFIPVVQRAMETFTTWAKTNREDIKSFAEQAVLSLERVIPIVGSLASGLSKIAVTVGSVVSKVADMVGGWENFGMVLGTLKRRPRRHINNGFASHDYTSLGMSTKRPMTSGGKIGATLTRDADPAAARKRA